jgi:hypothetical protein
MGRSCRRWRWYAVSAAVWLWLAHGAAAKGGVAASSPSMCPATGDAWDSASAAQSHISPQNESIAASLRAGTRRSQTLAWLVERLEMLNGRVYLFAGAYRRPGQGLLLRGGTSHAVTGPSGFRIIKVTVDPGFGDGTIATLGHELRHAVEILEALDAVDVGSVDQLYERIGFRVQAGVYETSAALATERQVRDDLRRCRF